ncbi:carboxylesterase family protein [Reichenbachiella versicolor]|uniref:carboxylesterase family protein n=1 Tax=Reichenbachiella versicolor TaxID=1821036 RepID=UPI000D6E579E|nr:hypothetical protein [Reichenbachiella versicolor]
MKTAIVYFQIYILLFFLFSCSKGDEETIEEITVEETIDEVETDDDGETIDEEDFNYEFTKQHFLHDLTGASFPYSFFQPKGADILSDQKYPLIIALHGTEYYLKSEAEFLNDSKTGYMALAWIEKENQKQYPAYVVAPNLNNGLWTKHFEYNDGWAGEESIDFIEKLLTTLLADYPNIDENRIYLTGHSMGGGATWYIATQMKERLAAIVPFAQSLSVNNSRFQEVLSNIDNDTFKNIPIWEFIHQDDKVGGAKTSRMMFSRLQSKGYSPVYTHWYDDQEFSLTDAAIETAIGNNKKYFYSEYAYDCGDDCHYVMTTALKQDYLFKWLFSQRKG